MVTECESCSAEVEDGAKFCASCGAAQPGRCSNCGSPLEAEAKFCASCGTPTEGGSPDPGVVAAGGRPPGGGNRLWVIAGGAALVVLLVVFAVVRDSPPDPLSANNCEELVDAMIGIFQAALDDVADAFSADDAVMEVAYAKQAPFFAAVDSRSSTLGCSESELERLGCQRIFRLEPRGPAGQELFYSLVDSC